MIEEKKININPTQDGRKYLDWEGNDIKYPRLIHERGFLVYLKPEEIEMLDEYKDGDPFGIEDKVDSPFHSGRVKITIELITSFKKENSKTIELLDVGCGQGHITTKIKSHFPSMNISGMDVSLKAISYANDNYNGIDFIVGNAYDTPYSNDFFDIVICNNTWEHLTDPAKLAQNIHRILKPGGIFIISTPSRYRISNLIKAMFGKKVSINKHHITEYSVGQVFEILQFCKFRMLKVKGLQVKGQGGSPITRIFIHSLIKRIVALLLKTLGSHNILDSTVFYVAKKQ